MTHTQPAAWPAEDRAAHAARADWHGALGPFIAAHADALHPAASPRLHVLVGSGPALLGQPRAAVWAALCALDAWASARGGTLEWTLAAGVLPQEPHLPPTSTHGMPQPEHRTDAAAEARFWACRHAPSDAGITRWATHVERDGAALWFIGDPAFCAAAPGKRVLTCITITEDLAQPGAAPRVRAAVSTRAAAPAAPQAAPRAVPAQIVLPPHPLPAWLAGIRDGLHVPRAHVRFPRLLGWTAPGRLAVRGRGRGRVLHVPAGRSPRPVAAFTVGTLNGGHLVCLAQDHRAFGALAIRDGQLWVRDPHAPNTWKELCPAPETLAQPVTRAWLGPAPRARRLYVHTGCTGHTAHEGRATLHTISLPTHGAPTYDAQPTSAALRVSDGLITAYVSGHVTPRGTAGHVRLTRTLGYWKFHWRAHTSTVQLTHPALCEASPVFLARRGTRIAVAARLAPTAGPRRWALWLLGADAWSSARWSEETRAPTADLRPLHTQVQTFEPAVGLVWFRGAPALVCHTPGQRHVTLVGLGRTAAFTPARGDTQLPMPWPVHEQRFILGPTPVVRVMPSPCGTLLAFETTSGAVGAIRVKDGFACRGLR